jgi:hypothetical protein
MSYITISIHFNYRDEDKITAVSLPVAVVPRIGEQIARDSRLFEVNMVRYSYPGCLVMASEIGDYDATS